MRTLSTSFLLLQGLGVWAPLSFNSLWTRILYKLYTFLVIIVMSFYVTTGAIGLILTCTSVYDFCNHGCRLFSSVISFGKILNLIIRRKSIIDILDILERDPCLPRDSEENSIQNKHNRNCRSITTRYGMVTNLTISLLISHTIFHDIPARQLPRKTWVPYDYSGNGLYWLLCPLQVIAVSHSYIATVGYSSLVCGMFLEISTKFNILKYRFINLHETLNDAFIGDNVENEDILKIEKKLITDCVTYHLCLLNLAERVHSSFNIVLFLQYLCSTALLCFTTYTVTLMTPHSPGFIYILFYLSIILIDVFLYCSCANEVTLKSQDAAQSVFNMDWVNFSQRTWRSLVIIGCQSSRPIIVKIGYFVTLSLESFKSLVKVAYSIYNALQSLH